MALIPAKVIARIHATSDSLEELSWEWVLRADGQVSYRLIAVGERRERNPWIAAARLPAGDLQALGRGQEKARVVLEASPASAGIRPAGHGHSYPLGPTSGASWRRAPPLSVRPARMPAG